MQRIETKKRVHKFVVVAAVIVLVCSIWFYKNKHEIQKEDQSLSSLELDEIAGYYPLNVTETIDLEELKSFGLPIIIDFGADSCVPCKEMEPILKTLNEELAGKAIVLFVDVWKFNSLAEGFPIEVIPTQIFIDAQGNPYMPSENESVQYIQYTYRDTGELAFTAHQGGITEEQLREVLSEMGGTSDD